MSNVMPQLKTLRSKVAIQLCILLCMPLGMLAILGSSAGSFQDFIYLFSKESQAKNLVVFLCVVFATLSLSIFLLFTPLQLNKAFRFALLGVILLLTLFSLFHGFLPALASVFLIYYAFRWYREV